MAEGNSSGIGSAPVAGQLTILPRSLEGNEEKRQKYEITEDPQKRNYQARGGNTYDLGNIRLSSLFSDSYTNSSENSREFQPQRMYDPCQGNCSSSYRIAA